MSRKTGVSAITKPIKIWKIETMDIICIPFEYKNKKQQSALSELLNQLPPENRSFFRSQLFRDTYLWTEDESGKAVGMVIFSPSQLSPEYFPVRPSDRVMMECLIVQKGHNLRHLFRLFYRQYDFSQVNFPLMLIAHPATSQGLKLDKRLGFQPYSGELLYYYAKNKQSLPLF
jgi:hypothetical protein